MNAITFIGPKVETEIGKKRIVHWFLAKNLVPHINEIRELAKKSSSFRMGHWDSFKYVFRRNSSSLFKFENEYRESSKKLFELHYIWNNIDVFFEKSESPAPQIQTKENIDLLSDYKRLRENESIDKWYFNDGFRLIKYINHIITTERTAAYNTVSINIALVALVLAALAALVFK